MGVEGQAGLLCFSPSGDGVEMRNVVDGEVIATERVVADGVARAVTAEGCAGTESVEFSSDTRRLFTESSFTCENGETRAGSGVMSFISPTQWIDVRALTIGGEPVAWVQRYAAATAESLEEHRVQDPAASDRTNVRSRRQLAAQAIDLDDVEEALGRIDAEAVKIWIATHEDEFDLDGSALVRLAEAGVPDDVIDVIVAVSFPSRFALTPQGVPSEVVDRVATDAYRSGTRVGYSSFLWDPYYWDPFYAPIGYRYSPFGYSGYGYRGYYGYVPTTVAVIPRERTVVRSGGRMVAGQGYRGPDSSGGGGSTSRPSGGSSGGSADDGGGSGGSSAPAPSPAPRRTARPR
jgi:uncharacterized membrane protein YgcG